MHSELKPFLLRLRVNNAIRKLGYDGGPGSGNWGHKGRPGLVGGSSRSRVAPNGQGGASGGKQYRGGRSDIGYFNSRKDWLNGLTGEKQSEATKILNAVRKDIPSTSEMSPEEHIMKNTPMNVREKLLDYVGEARSWRDRGYKLQVENLEPDEWMYLENLGEALDKRYADPGETIFSDEEMLNCNFDDKFGLMSDEEKEFYLDMKAKACGIPNSGKSIGDYSGKFQVEVGAKKEKKIPDSPNENREWPEMVDTNDEKFKSLLNISNEMTKKSVYDFNNNFDMNNTEKDMLLSINSNLTKDEAYKTITDFSRYLDLKDDLLGGEFFKKMGNLYNTGGENLGTYNPIGQLDELHSSSLYSFLNALALNENPPLTISGGGDILEMGLIMDSKVPTEVKAAYLTLKAAALGTPISDMDWRTASSALSDWKDTMRNNKIAQKENKKREEYNESKKKNVVVIKGDAISEGVNKLRKENGQYTFDEIKNVGDVMLSDFEKAVTERKTKIDSLYHEYNELMKESVSLEWTPGETDEEHAKRRQEIREKANEKWKEYWTAKNESPVENIASDFVKRVRRTGYDNKEEMKKHLQPPRSKTKKYVEEAYQHYPTDWIERAVANGSMFVYKAQSRGHYSPGEIYIDGDGDRAKEVATHELGHQFEDLIPGIRDTEKSFYESRTKDEPLVKLRDITGIKGYRSDEKTRKDNFVNPYIGKDYNGKYYEIVSMGFQYAFHEPEKLLQDKEYAKMILGLLAVG